MRVTVFGSARVQPGSDEYEDARRLGTLLARRGDVIVSGGYGGIMEAVSRGAHEARGRVVGVTMAPWAGRLAPNTFLSEENRAESLFSRIELMVESDALIAMPGGAGTLGELALAWNMRQMNLMKSKPLIVVGPRWQRLFAVFREVLIANDHDFNLVTPAASVEEALTHLH